MLQSYALFALPFILQSIRARACWAWYRVWSLTTRSQRLLIQIEAGYQRTPACWLVEQVGPCCRSHSPLPASGSRWISVRRSWLKGWSFKGGSTARTKSSWRSSVLATATMALTGEWCLTAMGTSQKWELFFEQFVDHMLKYPSPLFQRSDQDLDCGKSDFKF